MAKTSIFFCSFLLVLLNLSYNKSPFNQYYHKSVPSSAILIISLPNNDKMPVLGLQFHFWQFSSYLQWIYINYIQMHWCCRLSTSDIYQIWLLSHVLVFNLLSAWGKIQNMKRLKTNFKGGHFWPLMHIVLSHWKLKISHELRLNEKFFSPDIWSQNNPILWQHNFHFTKKIASKSEKVHL